MNKTILITGSTDGIGKLLAVKLAKEGHEIYLHGRNSEKLDSVIAEIGKVSKNENIKGFIADFSDLNEVRKMAAQVNNELQKIDVLINNAGIYKSSQTTTNDNFDIRFAVNYFSPFVLTHALLPLLKKGTASRIINLSSAAQSAVSMEVLAGEQQVSTHEAYAQSKLALTMWSIYLAENESDLNVIAVNPGSLLNTKMVREGFGQIWSSADKGTDILYDLSISEKHKDASGKYYDNDSGAFGTIHPAGTNKVAINTLIEKTKDVLNEN